MSLMIYARQAVCAMLARKWYAWALRLALRALSVICPGVAGPAPARAPSPWLAGSTHRWHTNPIYAATRDRVDGHSARVAVLILQFMPDAPVELLRAAITHDLGENAVGDLASPVKWRNPALYAALAALEAEALSEMGLRFPALRADHAALLSLCDGLDAYLWAVTHCPQHVAARDDWRAMFARLRAAAVRLGHRAKFDEIVAGVCGGKF